MFRFDGRTIRVDKASDNGPRNPGRGGGQAGGFMGGRGGYGGMPMGGYGQQAPYGMPAPVYGHAGGYPGRGGYQQPVYGAPPAQGWFSAVLDDD